MRLLRRAAILALGLAAASPSVAAAHAQLVSSTPAADATLGSLPAAVVLVYDDPLRNDSSFQVLGPGGLTVASGAPDPGSATSMTGPLPQLPDGTYEVRWTAISSNDGFIERGSFSFTVALATGEPSASVSAATPSAPESAQASPGPTTPTAGGDAGGGLSSDILVPIAAVGILVGIGLGWRLRRRGAA